MAAVSDWFTGQFEDPALADAARLTAYGVQAHPATIQQPKGRLVDLIDALVDRAACGEDVQAPLRAAVDELDELEPPFTGYDELRFGRPTSRQAWIERVRSAYLGHQVTPAEIVDPLGDTAPEGADPWVEGAAASYDLELSEYDDQWPATYQRAADAIRRALGDTALVLQHVGSTSVPGLAAKPLIDIDLILADPDDEAGYVPMLERLDYVLRVREPWWYGHRCLRGSDPAVNLHVFAPGTPEPVRHRLFRDWLREHADDRTAYAAAKRTAMDQATAHGEHTMQYNARKEPMIREIYRRVFTARGWL